MLIRLFFFLSFSFFALGLIHGQNKHSKNFGHLDYTDGLTNNWVMSMVEDDNGFMWFGTTAGLNRFDGYTIKTFTHEPSDSTSLIDDLILSLEKDQLGRLWISTPKGTVAFDPNREAFIPENLMIAGTKGESYTWYDFARVVGDSNLLFRSGGVNSLTWYNIYSKKLHPYQPDGMDVLQNPKQQVAHFLVNKERLYIVYRNGVIHIVDYKRNVIINKITALQDKINTTSLGLRLFVDDEQNMWIYSGKGDIGLFCIDQNYRLKHFHTNSKPSINVNIITCIVQDDDLNLWIGTDHGGLNILSADHTKSEYILPDLTIKTGLSQNVIKCMYKSLNHIIWIGTYKEGVNYFHKNLFKFQHYSNLLGLNNKTANDINCFAEDRLGNLFLGTNGDGLIYFDRTKNVFTRMLEQVIGSEVIVSILYDSEDKLWIGTYFGGLIKYDGKIITRYKHNPNDTNSISDNSIWDIFEDSRGDMWIGTTHGGLDLFDRDKNTFIHYNREGASAISTNFVVRIAEDKQGNIWFGSDLGIFMFDYLNKRFTRYCHDKEDENSLSDDFITKVFIDHFNNIWIGTRVGLNLLDRKNKRFIAFNTENGLSNNYIMGIQESSEGGLWISTSKGVCKLMVEYNDDGGYVGHKIIRFNETDGLQGREFNEGSDFKTSNGELLFGGTNGFNLFIPEREFKLDSTLNSYIYNFKLFGREYEFNNQTNENYAILNNREIHLSHKQNVFSLAFVAIHYIASDKIKYRYKLEGFNERWIYSDWKDRKATFTNLGQGKYQLVVQASVFNSDWNRSESTMKIIIHPPWYRTWVAFVCYYLLLILVVIILRRVIVASERIRYQQEESEMEIDRQQELNVLKTRFFTNVSHEFRTPLTLIITPLEKILKGNVDSTMRRHLDLMNQNSKRLLLLVNQLLDFRKIEENKLQLETTYGNVIHFIEQTIGSFTDFQDSKNVKLEFLTEESDLFMLFDHDKLEKIMLNLLSNAFKFTLSGGSIKVHTKCVLQEERDWLSINVEDNGIGIGEEELKRIFDRFYQADVPDHLLATGSGIGLSLVQDFVERHGGSVAVDSIKGKGCVFNVLLPIHKKGLGDIDDASTLKSDNIKESISEKVSENKSQKTILLVEDNSEFRFYLQDSLKDSYRVLEAKNGKVALEIIKIDQPDLIVSDVMMPEMDGLQLCNEIKTNATFSHIPVILLTAKTSQQNKLEGLSQGADDYISKPFSMDILTSRIVYLINLRQKFKKEYQESFKVNTRSKSITPLDEKLLDKAMQRINDNISNSSFTVEGLSADLGMSRVYLYKKLSALTGKTPIELIRLVRLKKAAELLMQDELNVSEITYAVGFTDPKYFSKLFKAEFNMLPSKYSKNQE